MSKKSKNCYLRVSLILVFLGFIVIQTLTSSLFYRSIPVALTIRRFLTLLQYIPFFVVICYKLFKDIKKCAALGTRGISALSTLYYGFLLYYISISVYRFLVHMEVKENLYYTIVLAGSLALFILLQEKELVLSIKDYVVSAFWVVGLLMVYRVIYLVFFSEMFERAPINVNLTTGIIAMILPVFFRITCDKTFPALYRIISSVLIAATLIIIALTGSRSIFGLSCTIVIIEMFTKWKKNFLSTLVPITLSIACICIFYQFDIGDMRYSIYRETNGLIVNKEDNDSYFSASKGNSTSVNNLISSNPDHQISNIQSSSNSFDDTSPSEEKAAKLQVIDSDRVRSQLVQWGLQQVKGNWIIGSGDVLYLYRMDETHIYQQSSHNFIIETIICYGMIGLIILLVIVFTMLSSLGIISKTKLMLSQSKLAVILVFLFYVALGFVQPTVYNPLVCPICLFFLTFHTGIEEGEFGHR